MGEVWEQEPAVGFTMGDAQEALAAVMRNSADPMVLLDLDGMVLKWNAAAEDMYGWSHQEAVGSTLLFIDPDRRRRVLSDLRAIASSGCVGNLELPSLRADEMRVRSHVIGIPVHDEDEDAAGVLLIVRDTAADERFERHRRDFATLVSRCLSGPMHALLGEVKLLGRRELWDDESRRTRVLNAVADAAGQAARLTDRLSLLADYEAPWAIGATQTVSMNDLLSDIVADLPSGRVTVELDMASESVKADRAAVAAALRALVDRPDQGGGTGARPLSVTVFDSEGGCRVDVNDRYWPDPLEHGTFGRPEAAEAEIALSVAESVFTAHGGTVKVVREGRGATISLWLPHAAERVDWGTS
jgi:PAS domain S-box-containing protein